MSETEETLLREDLKRYKEALEWIEDMGPIFYSEELEPGNPDTPRRLPTELSRYAGPFQSLFGTVRDALRPGTLRRTKER